MKKIKYLFLLISTFTILCGCDTPHGPDHVGDRVRGEHTLRHIGERTELNGSVSGTFFILLGGMQGSMTSESVLYFSWEMNDGTYAICKLPFCKIRVKLVEEQEIPTIRFRWRPDYHRKRPLEYIMKKRVIYALILCKPEDWAPVIKMPLIEK